MASAAQQLKRILRRRDLVLYGLVILTPTASFPVFGVIQQSSGGHITLSYFLAMVAMLFTAISYGRMAAEFPSAGSTYVYARESFGDKIGFLAGWAMILDYFLIPLLSVIYIGLTLARIWPSVPYSLWVLLFTFGITATNLRGVRMTARANFILITLMFICCVWFVAAGILFLLSRPEPALGERLSFSASSVPALLQGAGLATLSYIGFDAISTLSEESLNPKRDVPAATILTCILQGFICIATVFIASRVWPDFHAFAQVETAILDIANRSGGVNLFNAVSAVLVVAGVASSLTGQAGAARLLYAMGREGVLSKKVFGQVDEKVSAPSGGLYVMSALTLAGAFVTDFSLSVELVNFGAFVGFILVNLCVIQQFFFRQRRRRGFAFLTNLLIPLLGASICVLVWLSLTVKAKLVGFAWLGIGATYFFLLMRGKSILHSLEMHS